MTRRDPLLTALLWWTAIVTGVLVWLPLVRGATQGEAYLWQLGAGIGGRGVGGDYWLLVVAALFVGALLFFGWRGARQPFHWLLLAFHLPLAAAVAYAAWSDPGGFRFEGATAGVDIPLAVIGPLLFGGFAVAAIAWVAREMGARTRRELAPWVWTRATRVRLALIATLVPIQVMLFRSGDVQSTQNLIGVGLVGWQWVMVNRVFAGSRP